MCAPHRSAARGDFAVERSKTVLRCVRIIEGKAVEGKGQPTETH
jgi:hypothetical protein